MVQFAFRDVSGETVKRALAEGVYMFGKCAKFVVVGDHPTVLQCGRCHELGHHTNSTVCRIPKTAARCFMCGGPHDSKAHSFHCEGAHKVAGICDCRLKCIVCGKLSHHARGRGCPKRGDFAPPRLAGAQTTTDPTTPAPRARRTGRGTGRADPPPDPSTPPQPPPPLTVPGD